MEKEIRVPLKYIKERVRTIRGNMNFAKSVLHGKKSLIDAYKFRLDELILMWQIINKISYTRACNELGVHYEDTSVISRTGLVQVEEEKK